MWRTDDRTRLLLVPPLLLGLELLMVWPRLPSVHKAGEQNEAVFSVISIEPQTRQRGQPVRASGVRTDEAEGVHWEDRGGSEGLFEDEKEINSRQVRNFHERLHSCKI